MPRPAEQPPAKPSGGVSLWQKIFGSPAEPAPKPSTESADRVDEFADSLDTERDAERPVGDRQSQWASDDARFSNEPIETNELDFREVERSEGEPGDETADREPSRDDQESGDRKPRRSRRRRGGRGRKTEERPAGRRPSSRRREPELMETPGADDFDDDFEDLSIGDAGDSDEDLEQSDDDQDLDDGDEALNGDAAPSRSRAAGHRSIPSWDEAIGIMVEANMQTRSQRRPPSGGSGQRGRPRGGRRRRKPS